MTTCIFHRSGELIDGFDIAGHSGYAEAGSDIVCSAVSTASHMAMLGIEQVLGIRCKSHHDAKKGRMRFTASDPEKAQPFFRALEEELVEIERQYPEYFRVVS
ncbi:MAG: ribosomal-processing cysteine protease Prp [Clostridia bacterium]|nr:ribosomal-processing cysteine protease Prp [Clostridia bacterium]